MNTDIPRVSYIVLNPTNQPNYGFWTKVRKRKQAMLLLTAEIREWLDENTRERVVVGHSCIYFENEKDATFFNLTH